VVALGKAAAGDYLDPARAPICWACQVYSPDGVAAGNGNAPTAGEAMALAWIHVWAPDALDRASRWTPRGALRHPGRLALRAHAAGDEHAGALKYSPVANGNGGSTPELDSTA
jgi:hypothetical protein